MFWTHCISVYSHPSSWTPILPKKGLPIRKAWESAAPGESHERRFWSQGPLIIDTVGHEKVESSLRYKPFNTHASSAAWSRLLGLLRFGDEKNIQYIEGPLMLTASNSPTAPIRKLCWKLQATSGHVPEFLNVRILLALAQPDERSSVSLPYGFIECLVDQK